uniref:CBS domain-containing protein n=1 Tax=Toxoplasma gondii COUG TaxID=1074873 RepID=A0A2G8XPN0_TOXGO|nr:CBS domain-containing protein [Toxoplasma gondii COUG]
MRGRRQRQRPRKCLCLSSFPSAKFHRSCTGQSFLGKVDSPVRPYARNSAGVALSSTASLPSPSFAFSCSLSAPPCGIESEPLSRKAPQLSCGALRRAARYLRSPLRSAPSVLFTLFFVVSLSSPFFRLGVLPSFLGNERVTLTGGSSGRPSPEPHALAATATPATNSLFGHGLETGALLTETRNEGTEREHRRKHAGDAGPGHARGAQVSVAQADPFRGSAKGGSGERAVDSRSDDGEGDADNPLFHSPYWQAAAVSGKAPLEAADVLLPWGSERVDTRRVEHANPSRREKGGEEVYVVTERPQTAPSSSTSTSAPTSSEEKEDGHSPGDRKEAKLSPFWRTVYAAVTVGLIGVAGLASGLTTGYMAFDELQLLVLQETGSPRARQQAETVYRIVQGNRHQLLVTLLLCNSLAMEALPLFLDRLLTPVLAVLISVTAILFVGEILPQALCTGKYQLPIAAALAPTVRLLIIVFAPIVYPTSKLLDRFVRTEHRTHLYARSHLKALIGLHQKDRRSPLLLQHSIDQRRQERLPTAEGDSSSRRTRRPSSGQDDVTGGTMTAMALAVPDAGETPGSFARTAQDRQGGAAYSASRQGDEVRKLEGATATDTPTPRSVGEGRGLEQRPVRESSTMGARFSAGDRRPVSPQNRSPMRNTEAEGETRDGALQGGSLHPSMQQAGLHAPGWSDNREPEGATHKTREDLGKAVGLHRDEVLIMQGALDMACKSICDFMVPLHDVYMLECSMRLTRELLVDVLRKGHSRIPVYEGRRSNVRGVLLVKSLILIDPKAGIRIRDLMRGRTFRRLCTPLFVAPSVNPYQLLNEFQEGRCHLAFVTNDVATYQHAWKQDVDVPTTADLLGIVTLEDVIEELIQEEIMDEFDKRMTGVGPSAARAMRSAGSGHSGVLSSTPGASRFPAMDTSAFLGLEPPRHESGSELSDRLGTRSNTDAYLPLARASTTLSRFASLFALEEAASCASPSAPFIRTPPHLGSRAALLFTAGDRAPGPSKGDQGEDHPETINGNKVGKRLCKSKTSECPFQGVRADGAGAAAGLTDRSSCSSSAAHDSNGSRSVCSGGTACEADSLIEDRPFSPGKQEVHRLRSEMKGFSESPASLLLSPDTSVSGVMSPKRQCEVSSGTHLGSAGEVISPEVCAREALGDHSFPSSQTPGGRRAQRRRSM